MRALARSSEPIAAEVLIDQAEVHLDAGDVGGCSGQFGADEEIGRAGGIFAETDQDAGVGAVGCGRGRAGVAAGGGRGAKVS